MLILSNTHKLFQPEEYVIRMPPLVPAMAVSASITLHHSLSSAKPRPSLRDHSAHLIQCADTKPWQQTLRQIYVRPT